MFRIKRNSISETLQNKFKVIEHNYSTRHSEYNFKEDVEHVSGISLLTNFWKQQTRCHFLKPKW